MAAGEPIAVTLVRRDFYEGLCAVAATQNCIYTNGSSNLVVAPVYPAEAFRILGLDALSAAVSVIIANGTNYPLVMSEFWDDHCAMAGHPVTSDLVGSYQIDQLSPMTPGKTGGSSLLEDHIPGRRQHPLETGIDLFGVGAYAFNATNILYGNDGALAFSCGGQLIGISWSITQSGLVAGNNLGVSADLTTDNSDLKTFYNRTADVQSVFTASSGKLAISAALVPNTNTQGAALVRPASSIVVSVRPSK